MKRELVSEYYKSRRSYVFWLSIMFPVLFVGLQVIGYLLRKPVFEGTDAWSWYGFNENIRSIWGLIILPVVISFYGALICWFENENSNWKLIFIQPVSRGYVYFAKIVFVFGFVAISQLFLALFTIIGGSLMYLTGSIPIERIIVFDILSIPACIPLLVFQVWISTRFNSYLAPLIIGIAGNFIGFLEFADGTKILGAYNPWSIITIVFGANGQQSLNDLYLLVSVGMGLAFAIAAFLDIQYKDIS